jgi:hypothetical protein
MRKTKYRGPVSLACDWSYSAPYQCDEREAEPTIYPQESNPFIHAYNDRAAARKERFLKDAGHYLWTVGQELERYGFLPAGVVSNPAGIACSGDVWANYQHPDHDRWIYVNISEVGVDMIGEAPPIGTFPIQHSVTTRKDRITVMGRWREMPTKGTRGDPKSWRSLKEGPNNWYDANLNSLELAYELLRLLLIEPEAAGEFVQGSLFDQIAAA